MERRGRTRLLDGEAPGPSSSEPSRTTDGAPAPEPDAASANSADALIARRRRWIAELDRFENRKRPADTAPPRQP